MFTEVFCRVLKDPRFNLPKITPSQLLEFMGSVSIVLTKDIKPSVWDFTIDNIGDMRKYSQNDPLNSNYFTTCFVSPYVFNGVLLSMGDQLDLTNIQLYLLDSYYKQVSLWIERFKNDCKASGKKLVSDEELYIHFMNAFSTISTNFGEVAQSHFLTVSEKDILKDNRYQQIAPNVVKKTSVEKEISVYNSGVDLFNKKRSMKGSYHEFIKKINFHINKSN